MPSGAQETDVILIPDEETEAENAKLRMTIQEQDTDIKHLILNFKRARWVIKYLEQRNKQLEDQQTIMELQSIRENQQAVQQRGIELTTLEQEINNDRESWLDRVNLHLEKNMEKENRDKAILRRMACHYRA